MAGESQRLVDPLARAGDGPDRALRPQVLADVATGVGFYDQSALNKHFKRCYGITPTQFARAAAAA